MDSFLNALKNKSATIQATQFTPVKPDPIVAPVPVQDPIPVPITVKIERVLNRNRLDVYFSDIPSVEVRDNLKDQGFRFDGERKAWYHKDTLLNRLFLHNTFGAPDLLTVETPNSDYEPLIHTVPEERIGDTIKTPQIVNLETEEDSEKVSEEFRRYKMQVNALVAELKLDPADLMIRAIGCLYDSVFKVN